jgi:hypothetical protein
LLVLVILAVVIAGGVAILIKVLSWLFSGLRRKPTAEEAAALQAIHQGLAKMEGRVEVLESLVVERARKETGR